ncbi:unnamed protein product, partial [marine sediment metagenome]
QAGKAGVFAKWKGRQYRRAYVIPANPKTTMQKIIRGYFENAVDAWHTYTGLQRLVYSYLATGLVMSGFNLLVRRWMVAATKKLDLVLARWLAEHGHQFTDNFTLSLLRLTAGSFWQTIWTAKVRLRDPHPITP